MTYSHLFNLPNNTAGAALSDAFAVTVTVTVFFIVFFATPAFVLTVIFAVPSLFAVTTPFALTDATALLLLLKVTPFAVGLPLYFTVIVFFPPSSNWRVDGLTFRPVAYLYAFTVTVHL